MKKDSLKQEIILFESGIKPAIYLYGDKDGKNIKEARKLINKGYPYSEIDFDAKGILKRVENLIKRGHFEGNEDYHINRAKKYERIKGYIIFQDEQKKEKFEKTEQTKYDFGISLGYPPKACRYFQEKFHNLKETKDSVNVHYHGFTFSTSIQTLTEDIEWMMNTYRIPKEIESEILIFFIRNDETIQKEVKDPKRIRDTTYEILKEKKE